MIHSNVKSYNLFTSYFCIAEPGWLERHEAEAKCKEDGSSLASNLQYDLQNAEFAVAFDDAIVLSSGMGKRAWTDYRSEEGHTVYTSKNKSIDLTDFESKLFSLVEPNILSPAGPESLDLSQRISDIGLPVNYFEVILTSVDDKCLQADRFGQMYPVLCNKGFGMPICEQSVVTWGQECDDPISIAKDGKDGNEVSNQAVQEVPLQTKIPEEQQQYFMYI